MSMVSTQLPLASADLDHLARHAERLRALHVKGSPLVLVNVWDAASARRVERAGAVALGTSSAAIASSLGAKDGNLMAPADVFGALARITAVASVPVTADIEAGYGLTPPALVDALLGAGAVGCNLEDSDHARPGKLVDAGAIGDTLHRIRQAASERGVSIVVNARVDTILHGAGADPERLLTETVRRAQLYVDAGADCIYPIRLLDRAGLVELIASLSSPVNANVGPSTTVRDLAAWGVARVSIGPAAHKLAMDDLSRRAESLLAGGALN
jgi:2-methylisocitrate lyase-like PEP mutase family enzyme